mgnify:CR=1 FL=1
MGTSIGRSRHPARGRAGPKPFPGRSIFVRRKKRTDVFLQDFSVSRDGSAVTVETFSVGSMGYIRAMEAKQTGGEIHCSFYGTSDGVALFQQPVRQGGLAVVDMRDDGKVTDVVG